MKYYVGIYIIERGYGILSKPIPRRSRRNYNHGFLQAEIFKSVDISGNVRTIRFKFSERVPRKCSEYARLTAATRTRACLRKANEYRAAWFDDFFRQRRVSCSFNSTLGESTMEFRDFVERARVFKSFREDPRIVPNSPLNRPPLISFLAPRSNRGFETVNAIRRKTKRNVSTRLVFVSVNPKNKNVPSRE